MNSTALISPGVRSMSEITNVSRFRRVRDPAGSVEEKVQRLWLPIVRRTVHWFAGREQRPPPEFRSAQRKESQNLELLELERREIIGEILCLNPNYKAPADFKPLLKETKVPIPVKAYQGYNLIGLLLVPESNTQKRLEEETGAKIRVHGTKKATGEKMTCMKLLRQT